MMACIVNNNSTPIERHGLHYLISGVSGQSQRQPRPLGRLTPGVSVSCACRQQGKGRVVRGRGAHTWRSPGVEARPNRSMTRRSIGRRAHLPRVRLRPFDEERERRCICMHPPAAESRKPSVAAKHARTRRALRLSRAVQCSGDFTPRADRRRRRSSISRRSQFAKRKPLRQDAGSEGVFHRGRARSTEPTYLPVTYSYLQAISIGCMQEYYYTSFGI
jgi:hypothetical protein